MTAVEQELITLTVDDQEVSVPPGTNLVETAKELGTEVPVFCYNSRLPVVGACRMCLVAVELPPRPGTPADAPKPPPSIMTGCTTTVMPGMKVWTETEAVLKYREGIVEFLLINHPLDCPVCDAGGDCPLQDNSHNWGPKESRFVEQKRLLRKVHDLSPLVVLDQERCIVCYRCTRFMDDVAGEHELDFFDRGYNSVLGTLGDRPLQSKFHGNIIDLCPCGALTSNTYRFRARPGDLQTTQSVCAQCPVGCNLKLDVRRNELVRLRAEENADINDIWLCNKGEFTFEFVSTDRRLRAPLIQRAGELTEVEWDEALTHVAAKIKGIRDEHGAASIGVIGGQNIPNEDAFVLREFARSIIGTPHLDHRIGARTAGLPLADVPVPTPALADADRAGAILLIGTDVTNDLPVQWLRLRAAVTKRGTKLIVANPRATEPDRIAYHRLRHRPGTEAALLQGLLGAILETERSDELALTGEAAEAARTASLSPDRAAELTGVTAETIRAAAATFADAASAMVYAGPRLHRRTDQEAVAAAIYNLALATGNIRRSGGGMTLIPDGANGRGAERLGIVPGENGLPAGEIIAAAAEGKIKCLYLVGENILETHPDREQAKRALANADLVVVHELFETATARTADAVLPALSFAERDGTLTNVEGRIQRLGVAVTPEGDGLADWRILANLSGHLDGSLGFSCAAEITLEAFEGVITPAMMRREAFPKEGVLLPVPEAEAQPNFAEVPPLVETVPASEGLRLLSDSELTGHETLIGLTPQLLATSPEPLVDINREDAARLGIGNGQIVTLRTGRGAVSRRARVGGRVPSGVVYTPDNLDSPRVNAILDWRQEAQSVELEPAAEAAALAGSAAGGQA
ncbi:MAG: NADH dehydrogenase (quinone) subunit G [Dehalococcoidia bacterium]|nr:NADH dehydrogenase (quinone) subunit G [Dehalococcoidia bacterium]